MTDSIPDRTPAYPHDDPRAPTHDRPDVLAGEVFAAPPRQARSRRSRDALIAAARSRFAANGYEATAVEDIAKDAGVAVGGFYLHFRSKRQVLLMLVDLLVQELDREPWSKPGDDTATIMNRIRLHFSSEFGHAGIYRAWNDAASRNPSLAALRDVIEAWVTAAVTAALSAVAAEPRGRPNVDVPVVSSMLSVIFWRVLDAQTEDRAAWSDTLVGALQNVLLEDVAAAAGETS